MEDHHKDMLHFPALLPEAESNLRVREDALAAVPAIPFLGLYVSQPLSVAGLRERRDFKHTTGEAACT